MPQEQPGFSRLGLILLALLALGWGCNWPIMKIVLEDVPPLTFRGICLVASGIGMLVIARLAGYPLAVPNNYWTRLLFLSVLNVIGWNLLAVYGVALMPSGRAALLAYTMPLWSMSLSLWLLDERLTPSRVAALGLGMIGVFVLMGSDLTSLKNSLGGVALMLGAAFAWGFGVVMLKRIGTPLSTIALTGWMLVIGGVPIAVAAILLEPGQWRPLGPASSFGMLYNIVVGFMFCYWAWNRIVLMVPVAVSSLSSLITPIVGVASGIWLLDERLTWNEIVAGTMILGAIWLVLRPASGAPKPA